MAVGGVEVGFQLRLFSGQLIEVGIGIGVGGVHLIQPGQCTLDRRDGFFDVAAHVLGRIELRFLGQQADLDARLRAGFAEKILVHPGHNPQQG